MQSPQPRYEYIVTVAFIVTIGLAITFLIDSSTVNPRFAFGGDLPEVSLSWLLIGSLVLLTAMGAEWIARPHPQPMNWVLRSFGPLRNVIPAFWFLPGLSVIAAYAFWRLFNPVLGGTAFLLALIAAASMLIVTLAAQYFSLDRQAEIHTPAQIVLHISGYLIAFGSFSAIYYTRYRTLYSATMVALVSALLVYALLNIQRRPISIGVALIAGIGIAELMWALNYWQTTFLLAGVVLVTVLYVVIGLLGYACSGQLDRRLLIEYSIVGVVLVGGVAYMSLR
ncbi:hypothetical protein [Chloroflexus sp.]|uniref:DUF5656 family protein n=1 Tax=Chloroflexus sp. TaxID=1904827 RepID=UPI00298F3329|nr:hypothetical protein [Chloroflexus sp.]MCS6886777.1 hypothetical protein [Chloroflexus sp.]MCX7859020.1 hypothetical protein [Chloroflexus sp.]MDW8403737.1 hypothetical protein [Chloroflexus sp.]